MNPNPGLTVKNSKAFLEAALCECPNGCYPFSNTVLQSDYFLQLTIAFDSYPTKGVVWKLPQRGQLKMVVAD